MTAYKEIVKEWISTLENILDFDIYKSDENELFIFSKGEIPLSDCNLIFDQIEYLASWVENDERVLGHQYEHFIEALESFIDDLESKNKKTVRY
jgi:hypothetical protein